MCEHHFCPFMEKCTLPTFQMAVWLGFQNWLVRSKFMLKTTDSGTIDGRNRRCLDGISWAQGALVWVEAEHMCMNMRGVRKPGTATVTTAARGLLATDKDLKMKPINSWATNGRL